MAENRETSLEAEGKSDSAFPMNANDVAVNILLSRAKSRKIRAGSSQLRHPHQ
jgi:hypothetical protein